MTDVRLTQEALEEWATGTPVAQVTQIVVEEWASVAATVAPTDYARAVIMA